MELVGDAGDGGSNNCLNRQLVSSCSSLARGRRQPTKSSETRKMLRIRATTMAVSRAPCGYWTASSTTSVFSSSLVVLPPSPSMSSFFDVVSSSANMDGVCECVVSWSRGAARVVAVEAMFGRRILTLGADWYMYMPRSGVDCCAMRTSVCVTYISVCRVPLGSFLRPGVSGDELAGRGSWI